MKRIFVILLFVVILITGCTRPLSKNTIKANGISIFFGFSSYAMFSENQKVIDDLLNKFSSLGFKKTKEAIDVGSAFNVCFSSKGKQVKRFQVDKNGVFILDGGAQYYKVSSGSFDYRHLKSIYEDSMKISVILSSQKENLIDLVTQMTKPTQQKPNLASSSNPFDYIDAHEDIYNRLVAGGQDTVDSFVDILRNSTEFGLDKYIMATVCSEITGIGNGSDKTWDTPKEWLDLYNERSEK